MPRTAIGGEEARTAKIPRAGADHGTLVSMTEIRRRYARGEVNCALALSVIIPAGRPDPRVDWILRDLSDQVLPGDLIEVIAVDPSFPEKEPSRSQDHPQIGVVRVAPKPNPWQGPQRLTRQDWWAASSARNTGIALASHDYVAFLDDRTKLGSIWLDRVRKGARSGAVIAGSYDVINQGRSILDHRRMLCPRSRKNCGGDWLYGGSFCLPLAWLLEVNGFEEGCDGLAGEDCVLGRMLVHAGYRVDFDAHMRSIKERPDGSEHGFRSVDKGTPTRSKSSAALVRFGSRARTEFTPNLRALRARLAAGGTFPDVDPTADHRDWFDGQLIRDADTWIDWRNTHADDRQAMQARRRRSTTVR